MSDLRIKAAAEAMRQKRRELQHLPLDRIYEELADAAVLAFFDSMKESARANLEALNRTASG